MQKDFSDTFLVLPSTINENKNMVFRYFNNI